MACPDASPDIDYAPFRGDGRTKIAPHELCIPGVIGKALTLGQCRMIVNMFLTVNRTTHSGQGNTLWVTVIYCHAHDIPYRLSVRPKLGYMIERIN